MLELDVGGQGMGCASRGYVCSAIMTDGNHYHFLFN